MLRLIFIEHPFMGRKKFKTVECTGIKFSDRKTKEYIICQFDGVEVFRFKYKDLVQLHQINPVTKEILKNL